VASPTLRYEVETAVDAYRAALVTRRQAFRAYSAAGVAMNDELARVLDVQRVQANVEAEVAHARLAVLLLVGEG